MKYILSSILFLIIAVVSGYVTYKADDRSGLQGSMFLISASSVFGSVIFYIAFINNF